MEGRGAFSSPTSGSQPFGESVPLDCEIHQGFFFFFLRDLDRMTRREARVEYFSPLQVGETLKNPHLQVEPWQNGVS